MKRICVVLICSIVCACGGFAAEKLTYIDLINRLVDLEQISVLPVAGEGCAQFSSYDRTSKYDETNRQVCKLVS